MKILLVILIIGLIVVCGVVDYYIEEKEEDMILYQGPVPEGYDEEHFRKTGETILMEVKK